jgi:hypothetical protein
VIFSSRSRGIVTVPVEAAAGGADHGEFCGYLDAAAAFRVQPGGEAAS